MQYIHINCDLGEGGENDAELMPMISACNIACGGHAGTVDSMYKTVALALEHNVEIGAHPSYPDKNNFGRESIEIPAEELKRSLVAQILSLKQIVESEGGKLSYIKPHGALYNDAAKDQDIARVVLDSVLEFGSDFNLFVPEKSVISSLEKGEIKLVLEAFADRNYNPDFSLVSRKNPGALITEKEAVFEHLFRMFSEGKIRCENGSEIVSNAETFCLHSDTPNAVEILQFLQIKLEEKGIKILHT